MQRYHRTGHRWLWLVLLPLALAAFAWALSNRVEMPVMDEVPGPGREGGP